MPSRPPQPDAACISGRCDLPLGRAMIVASDLRGSFRPRLPWPWDLSLNYRPERSTTKCSRSGKPPKPATSDLRAVSSRRKRISFGLRTSCALFFVASIYLETAMNPRWTRVSFSLETYGVARESASDGSDIATFRAQHGGGNVRSCNPSQTKPCCTATQHPRQ